VIFWMITVTLFLFLPNVSCLTTSLRRTHEEYSKYINNFLKYRGSQRNPREPTPQ
jgi:hypothetical protein